MKNYTIELTYTTGDSFNIYKHVELLDNEGSSKEACIENLKRIKEHYLWKKSVESQNETNLPKPKWLNVNKEHELYCINLITSANEYQMSCQWCDSFSDLLSGRVVCLEDDDMQFSFIEK